MFIQTIFIHIKNAIIYNYQQIFAVVFDSHNSYKNWDDGKYLPIMTLY